MFPPSHDQQRIVDAIRLVTGPSGRGPCCGWTSAPVVMSLQRGTAEVVGFVDNDPRTCGRRVLGSVLNGPGWLRSSIRDIIAIANRFPDEVRQQLLTEGASRNQIAVLPVADSDAALAATAATWFPDPLSVALSADRCAIATLRVGIFGSGVAGMKVWEALAEIDFADPVWFADNDRRKHGQTRLWLDVIAPVDIPSRRPDAIVIASISRGPIREQLHSLGIEPSRILTPDVTAPVEKIRDELAVDLAALNQHEMTQ
jgi:hypothetical protein